MEIIALILGIAILFNFVILRIKWNRKQYADTAVDLGMLLVLNAVFGGTILGVASATAGSTLISLYLMKKPVTLSSQFKNKDQTLSNIADKIDDLLR